MAVIAGCVLTGLTCTLYSGGVAGGWLYPVFLGHVCAYQHDKLVLIGCMSFSGICVPICAELDSKIPSTHFIIACNVLPFWQWLVADCTLPYFLFCFYNASLWVIHGNSVDD
ncbi:hypothetical protein EDD15DRAFT_2267673 [Pisolithus albus]|nr:hypothetical protein EDD15DRAFT_2267673 [Pisolithus albus]